MSESQTLRIGALARRVGVNVQTIRYYKRRGLLLAPERAASGYRTYSNEAIRRLTFIRSAQVLGFRLAEIEELLSLRVQPGMTCAYVRKRARQKIATVEEKMEQLRHIRNALSNLAATCSGTGPTSEYPILKSLEGEAR